MPHRLSRQELYELIWSEPVTAIAKRLDVSNVAVAKACHRADVPVPPRGYWAQLKAGKRTTRRPLPPRYPGASDTITIGGPRWQYFQQEPVKPGAAVPPPPTFDEAIEAVRSRVEKLVGKVQVPRLLDRPHPQIATELTADDQRRAKFAKSGYSWDRPLHDSPEARRRLRIWNAVFLGCAKAGAKPHLTTAKYGSADCRVSVQVGDQHIELAIETIKSSKGAKDERKRERLRLTIKQAAENPPVPTIWEDAEAADIEAQLTQVVVSIIVMGEVAYRRQRLSSHQWDVERQARVDAEEQKRIEDEVRRAEEQRAREAQERVDRLLAQAAALQQATTIRGYVAVVRGRCGELGISVDQVEAWASWALAQADRLDPVVNGTIAQTLGTD